MRNIERDKEKHYLGDREDDIIEKQLVLDLMGESYKKLTSGYNVNDREKNTVVFLEFGTRKYRIGIVHIELRSDLLPISCLNFKLLCQGFEPKTSFNSNDYNTSSSNLINNFNNNLTNIANGGYKGTRIHRIYKDFILQGGDVLDTQGQCSISALGNGFIRDESFVLRHTGPGCVSYCGHGADTVGSIFQISFRRCPELDENCVVFGCLASEESFKTLQRLNEYGTESGVPKEEIRIVNCGIAWEYEDS